MFAAANAISIPLTGWLTQRFGQIRLFVNVQLTEQANPYNPTFTNYINETSSLLAINQEQSYDLFDKVLVVQADMLGINDIFWISSLIFIALIPLVWLTKPGKMADSGGATSYE